MQLLSNWLWEYQSGDIIIKFELPSLKFYWGNDPESVSNPVWEEVTGQTRRFIDYAFNGTEPCQLTSIPTGLSVTGSAGNHPTITWDPNSEQGLGGYKLYQSIDGDPYFLLTTLDALTTSYIDQSVIVGNSIFDPSVCYTISAYGNINVESPRSQPKCISFSGLNKDLNSKIEEKHYETKLFNAFPNPFNPTTIISFQLKKYSLVKIKIYDILGKEVTTLINSSFDEGIHEIEFNTGNLPSGTYIYTLETEAYQESKIFNILK